MNKGLTGIISSIATALYLVAAGVLCLLKRGIFNKGNGPIYNGVTNIFGGDFGHVLAIILGVIAIAGGIFLLLRMFGVSISIINLCMIILAVLWVVIIIFDIIYGFKSNYGFWGFLLNIGANGLVLSGILASTEQFGGK